MTSREPYVLLDSRRFDNSYLILFGLLLILSGCGGGGGGGSGGGEPPAPLVYTGNENAAVITAESGRTLAAAVIGAGAVNVIVARIKGQPAQLLPNACA